MTKSARTHAPVVDLNARRSRRDDDPEAAGRRLFERLSADADDTITALVAGGVL